MLSLLVLGLWLICHLETAAVPASRCVLRTQGCCPMVAISFIPSLMLRATVWRPGTTSSPHTTPHPPLSITRARAVRDLNSGLATLGTSFCCSSYIWCPGSQKGPFFFRSLGEDQPACTQGGFEPVHEHCLLPSDEEEGCLPKVLFVSGAALCPIRTRQLCSLLALDHNPF